MPRPADLPPMSPDPSVRCTGCGFAWNSASMAEGLRLLGSCPKCGGALAFRDGAGGGRFDAEPVEIAVAPHLVLGIPRR